MKNITRIALITVFCLVGFWQPVFSQDAGIEWDILNQEVIKLYRESNYAKAEPLYKRSLAIWEKALG